MTEPAPNMQPHIPEQPEAGGIAPLTVEGWKFSQQLSNPVAAETPDPEAALKAIQKLRTKYGDDNVMLGPGYGEDGGRNDSLTSIYLREGARPRSLARRIGASIFGPK